MLPVNADNQHHGASYMDTVLQHMLALHAEPHTLL